MKHFWKRAICVLMSLVMVFTLSSTAFAAEATSTQIVTYGGIEYTITTREGICTVVDQTTGTKATYNQSTGLLVLESGDSSESITIDIQNLMLESMISPMASNSSDNNEYAYDYSLKTYNGRQYNFWEIQIPEKIKMTYVNVNNQAYLYDFRDNVDEMREAQDSVLFGWGRTILAAIMGVVAVTPVGTIATAVLAVLSVLVGSDSIPDLIGYSETIAQCKENCEDAFNAVIVYSTPST